MLPARVAIRQRISNIRLAAALGERGQALSVGDDGTVRLWDLDSGREVRRFEGHGGWVWAVAARSVLGATIVASGRSAHSPR